MMRPLIVMLLSLWGWTQAMAQPCSRLDFQDRKPTRVLKRFIRECKATGFLKPDSGLIHLSEWIDTDGQINWQVWAQTNWQQYQSIASFRGHCTDCLAPIGWTIVANRLVLRYTLNQSEDTLSKAESTCLQTIVARYVTILPPLPVPPQTVPMLDSNGQLILDKTGEPKMRPYVRNVAAGNGGGNNTHITFKKDGSIKKGLSL